MESCTHVIALIMNKPVVLSVSKKTVITMSDMILPCISTEEEIIGGYANLRIQILVAVVLLNFAIVCLLLFYCIIV